MSQSGATGRVLVVAADGGNSKTDLILATATGDVLAQVRGAGTRRDAGLPASAMHPVLTELTSQAVEEAGLPDDTVVDVGVFFCANVDTEEERKSLGAALAATGRFGHLELGNDTMAVLNAGAVDGWGIAIVTGAGINAVAVDRAGRTESFLAMGRCSGDLGGGGWVAEEGQAAAIRAVDGRGPATMLTRLIPEFFGLADPYQVALAVANADIPWSRMLHACPVVYRAAEAGDEVARAIIETQADEVGTMVEALAKRLAMDGSVPVVLGGGVMTHAGALNRAIVTEALHRHLPTAEPIFLTVAPVQGSLARALRLANQPV